MNKREQIVAVAQGLLNNETTPVRAAHSLYSLVIDSGILDQNEENLIAAIVSTTAHLPTGAITTLWNATVIDCKNAELAEADDLWRERMCSLSRNILGRLTSVH